MGSKPNPPPKTSNGSKTSSQPPGANPTSSGQPASSLDRTMRLMARFERFIWDIAGVVSLALALMTLLGILFPQLIGGVLLRGWVGWLNSLLGWGSLWIVVLLAVAGLWMLRRRHAGELPHIPWVQIMFFELVAFLSITLLSVLGGTNLQRAEQGLDGGQVGWGLAEMLRRLLAPIGLSGTLWRVLLLIPLLLLSLVIAIGFSKSLRDWARKAAWGGRPASLIEASGGEGVSEAPMPGQETATTVLDKRNKRPALPPQFRKKFSVQPEEVEKPAEQQPRDERLPPLELLINEQSLRADERHINLTAGLIEKTLSEFGIPAKVVGFRVGPTVTQFAVEPGFMEKSSGNTEADAARQKVRVAQISSLSRDLALALSAQRLRIEAPVPGRPYVGIEVPNSRSAVVRLRPLIEAEQFAKTGSPLAIALGRDVAGQPVIADLARMPHLLIAGTTGSGKSVCIAALTTCLVMNNTPDDLQLVMVDPKMVELVRFNGLPHLLGKVETDLERILGVLNWVVTEMDHRYKLLEVSHSRNIEVYNRKVSRRKGEKQLPRIVVMIDELADLMMSAPDQTEHSLVRLAQMARATGIHLVVATQRPSTDVVTGLIKANFPARISFAVASSIDSRVILDTQGAESLLGRGDMLFLPPEASGPVRAQGAIVTDQEIEKVITYWQKQSSPPQTEEQTEAPWEELLKEEAVLADRDDLVKKAIDIVKITQRASTSMLQRRLRVGYPRAARLMDELEELGIIGPSQGGGREREVLVGKDDNLSLSDFYQDEEGD
jgi:DNA segregation ATPase FtsK/SpoIIIE, S-DNA-T family